MFGSGAGSACMKASPKRLQLKTVNTQTSDPNRFLLLELCIRSYSTSHFKASHEIFVWCFRSPKTPQVKFYSFGVCAPCCRVHTMFSEFLTASRDPQGMFWEERERERVDPYSS